MTFIIGRDFAKLQVPEKRPCLLNPVEYCDEILHAH